MSSPLRRLERGFSLIELALVLLVLSIILSGALVPLTGTIEQARLTNARKDLEELRLAILGYTASRSDAGAGGYLPCPDCRNACGGVANDGQEDRDGFGACRVGSGNLPWATLGFGASDPWGSRYGYAVMPSFADSGQPFNLLIPDTRSTSTDLNVMRDGAGTEFLVGGNSASSEGAVAVVWSYGKNRHWAISQDHIAQPTPVGSAYDDERENGDGDNRFISREPTYDGVNASFDDILIWLSPAQVRGFLIQAGRL